MTWLLTCLQDRDRIGQREWGELCAVHGLLPAATVEALNEAALDLVGDLLCRGTDPVLIDPDVLKEML